MKLAHDVERALKEETKMNKELRENLQKWLENKDNADMCDDLFEKI